MEFLVCGKITKPKKGGKNALVDSCIWIRACSTRNMSGHEMMQGFKIFASTVSICKKKYKACFYDDPRELEKNANKRL